MFVILHRVLFTVTAVGLVCLAWPVIAEEPDCSAWSVRGVGIGLTVEQVELEQPKLKRYRRGTREARKSHPGWFAMMAAEDRSTGLYHFVTFDESGLSVIATTVMRVKKTSPEDILEAFCARWGEPETGGWLVPPIHTGNIIDQETWRWHSEACGIIASVTRIQRHIQAGVVNEKPVSFLVTIARLDALGSGAGTAERLIDG